MSNDQEKQGKPVPERAQSVTSGPDQGWSWVALFGTTLANFLMFGFLKSSGVLYVGLMNTFGVSREEASWPFSICESFFNLFAPLWSVAYFYLSVRSITLVCGALIGVSISLCYFASNIYYFVAFLGVVQGISISAMVIAYPIVINNYFVKKKSIAIGVTMAGSGLGGFCIPHLVSLLFHHYGLQGCMLVAGAIALNNMLAASLYRTPSWCKKKKHTELQENNNNNSIVVTIDEYALNNNDNNNNLDTVVTITEENLTKECFRKIYVFMNLLKNPLVFTIAFTFVLFEMANQIFPTIMVDYAINKGIAKSRAVWFISFYSIGDLLGGMFWGYWCDAKITSKVSLTLTGLVSLGSLWISLALYNNFYLIVAICASLGFFQSILLVCSHVFIIDFADPKTISACFGLARFLTGLFLLMKSPLIGLFRDQLQNYDFLIYTLAGGCGLMVLPWAVERWRERKRIP